MNDLFQRLKASFRDKDYRQIYTNGLIDSKIATQIKVLREQREWTQDELALETGMRQARISVLEDVNYSSWSLSTLRRLAEAFDLYLDVEFKEFGRLRTQLDELDRDHLSRRQFRDDPVFRDAELLPRNATEEEAGRAIVAELLGGSYNSPGGAGMGNVNVGQNPSTGGYRNEIVGGNTSQGSGIYRNV